MKGINMKFVRRIALLFFGLLISYSLFAQVNVRVNFHTYDKGSFKRAEFWVQQTDSIVFFRLLDDLQTEIRLPDKGAYEFHFSASNYRSFHKRYEIQGDTIINILLEDPTIELQEVVVTGKSSPRLTATGEIFRLSSKAKATGDPYRALSEIPTLMVDISAQSIKMRNGDTPLILIDGHLVNSGVNAIHPSNIESVEVSEVVNARFLQMGVTKIVNIKLKKELPWYSYIDVRTRHDIPLREGFGGANFEFGKKKFAIAGNIFGGYLFKDSTTYQSKEQMGDLRKEVAGASLSKSRDINGYLLFKWTPTKSDYIAALLKTEHKNSGVTMKQAGKYYNPTDTMALRYDGNDKTLDGGYLASIYYEHTFVGKQILSAYTKYNRGYADIKKEYKEIYDTQESSSLVDLKMLRDQYAFSLDYETGRQAYGSIAVGNNCEYTQDKVTDIVPSAPLNTNVGLFSNYTHATYTNLWKQLYYMLSAGVQGLAVKAADKNNAYWRPRAAVSLSWRLPKKQFIRGSYYLTNKLPLSTQLVAFNTSTNPWLRKVGNPYLVPMQIHQFDLNYNYSFKQFRLQLFGNHTRYSKIIEPFIYQNGGIQIQSFHNNGTYNSSAGGLGLNYSGKNWMWYINGGYTSEVFNGQSPKGSFNVQGNLRWNFGDFFLYTTIAWRNKSYSAISMTEYQNPTEAHVQVAWQATNNLYVSVGLPYYWGVKENTDIIQQQGYNSVQNIRFVSESLRPWILISWTIRKNSELELPSKNPDL